MVETIPRNSLLLSEIIDIGISTEFLLIGSRVWFDLLLS